MQLDLYVKTLDGYLEQEKVLRKVLVTNSAY